MIRSAGLILALVAAPALGGVSLGPSPYLSFADSPFQPLTFDWFHLENFEDGLLNTPGVSAAAGVVAGPHPLVDSVDADDGAIDGSGAGGSSFYSGFAITMFVFTFDEVALGALPTHAGIVWTDVGQVFAGSPGVGMTTFRAFDALGVEFAAASSIVGNGSGTSSTDEDRFFGAVNPGGISRIEISMDNSTDWEVDHLQYGLIPSPGAAMAGAVAGCLALRRRRVAG